MVERRTLVDGLKSTPSPIETAKEAAFVYKQKPESPPAPTVTVNRVPLSTRMREDFSKALKRASLERQLKGIEPNTLQDILEEAVEPWLKSNGHLS